MTADTPDPGHLPRAVAPVSKDLSDRVRSLRLGGREGKTAPRSRYLPWMVSLVLLLTTLAFGYRAYRVGGMASSAGSGTNLPAPIKGDRAASSPDAIPSTSAVADSSEVVLQNKGYVIPLSLVQVSPKVGGQLAWINPEFEEGKKFKIGDVLARIEQVDYKADRDQALASWESSKAKLEELDQTLPEEIKQAEADLAEARGLANQQRLETDRNRRLVLNNALSQREMEQVKFTYESTLARIKRLESMVRSAREGRLVHRRNQSKADMDQARAIYERAEARFGWTEIRAPISGTILTKKAELGNIVNPSAFSSGISASLCDMADLSKLEIDLSIQERDIAAVRENQPCLVMPEAYQADREFLARHPRGYEGFVSRLMPTADRAKGAVPVRVRIKDIPEDESGKYLRPEMSALVVFLRIPDKKTTPTANATNPSK